MKNEVIKILKSLGNIIKTEKISITKNGVWEGSQLKTRADQIAHDFLYRELPKVSKVPIVSEEDETSYRYKHRDYWIIDPIDGTASLANGYSGWVIQVALIKDNKVYFSVVHSPELDLTYYATLGQGSFLNDKRIYVNDLPLQKVLIDNYPAPEGIAKEVYKSLNCTDYIESGSIGLKICRVADGMANLFVKDVLVRDWDILPPLLILKEAGGILTKLDGKTYEASDNIEKKGIIASSSPKYLEEVVNFVSKASTA